MTALYEITGHYRELITQAQALAEANDGEVTDVALFEALQAVGGELQEKAIAVAKFLRNVESDADAIDAAAKEMKARADRLRKRVDGLKAYLLDNMQTCAIARIECPYFTLAIRKNPHSVVVFDEAQIPATFMVTPPAPAARPDKSAIKDALKAGTDVPGCRLDQTERLVIS